MGVRERTERALRRSGRGGLVPVEVSGGLTMQVVTAMIRPFMLERVYDALRAIEGPM